MTKAIFIASSHSAYDDRPGEAYHFPNRYLSRIAQTLGDWVIFYQGKRGGISGYYAVQRVAQISPDPSDPTHSYAILDRGSRLDFERPVPRLRPSGLPYETGLPLSRGSNTSAVRLISDGDFAAIIDEGLRQDLTDPDGLPRTGPLPSERPAEWPTELPPELPGGMSAPPLPPFLPPGADRGMILSSRAFRDRAFARLVKTAYAGRCCMTGLALRNGGGRPEVEAAHIIPVEANGPDSVNNGLALSGTVHWMFDRGLVGVDEDFSLLIADDHATTELANKLFVADRKLILPPDALHGPHPHYLKWHRENRFKG